MRFKLIMKYMVFLISVYVLLKYPCFGMDEETEHWERICSLTNRVEHEEELSPEQRKLIKEEVAELYKVLIMLQKNLEIAFKYVDSTEKLILEKELRQKEILEETKTNKKIRNKRKRESEKTNNKHSYKKLRKNDKVEEDLKTLPSPLIPGI